MSQTVFTDDDLMRLDELLGGFAEAGSTMRVDEAQAFFTALITGPDAVDPDLWWEEVIGDAVFENDEDEQTVRALLEKLWTSTADELADGDGVDLILYPDENDQDDYWTWCNAYLYALEVVPTDWYDVEDEGFDEMMYPIFALGGLFDEEDGKEPLVSFTAAEIEAMKQELPDAIAAAWRYWNAKKQTPDTIRREGDKVGRNDPCPCGSGKKYKACCGKS
ncbi:YecA family protein [Paludibacterium paludis]|uniref:YecA family protein n=1 Tax=Paludibacterium paludis TaxID=1225769 RepID=A0A918NY22_9NEIS|nr:YecA family protein [Paludibacterium paludis]GGY06053.1 hypothetical protein GCM10011289_05590 [Paludibacterium paludis]